MGTDAITPLITGGGVFGVLLGVIVYLVTQNWRLTTRLSEVQERVSIVAEERRAAVEALRDRDRADAHSREELAAQRIAELTALLQVTSPLRMGTVESE